MPANETRRSRTTVLADSAERAEQINIDRARAALQHAADARNELGANPDARRLEVHAGDAVHF